MRPDLSGVDPLVANLTHRVCIGDLPTRAAHQFGDRIAIVDGGVALSYSELEARSNAIARGMAARGHERGDAVALQLQNRWEFAVAFFACAKLGVVAMPINLALSADDIAYQLTDSGVTAVFTEDGFVPVLEAALDSAPHAAVRAVYRVGGNEPVGGLDTVAFGDLAGAETSPVEVVVEDRDVLHCLYTSGTTSRPKGVVTSHVAVQIGVLTTAVTAGLRPDVVPPVQPIVLPLFHVTALDVVLLPTLVVGGTAVLLRGFDAAEVVGVFATHAVTNIALLPMMWAAILREPGLEHADTDSLRTGFYAMAPMPASLLTALRERFPNAAIILGSGQTETTPVSEMQWPGHQGVKDDSWGPAVPTTDIAIMGSDGRLLGAGQEGEIVYRTPQLMEGYWNNRDANTAAFAGGWFHGGDIGYLDEDGVVWFTDRAKDIVKSGGENVSSVEVERVLLAHDRVGEAAVVGLPDERWGEAVTAIVVAVGEGDDALAEDIREFARGRLAGFKVPKKVVFVPALPKTATGKIQKHRLR
ncbi:AMP-binding protein [Tsukamurella sp. 8F]|uniref:class I adenylate-forming enzyme family protein n=1 Tax=unclassified Tsukamurella TaxID=2633480 RepID=UPI0023BA198C|nr:MULTISPECIES: AMP-binding protein [unclassified Tsukamurella]MDF0530270.1 AMP-binding protein [Tsukamurella sp. 8J]MDF0588588.1 AMP-binding protein [Tsukamurella sp. 8F]